jgi:putative phosphoesterase
MVLGIISDTHGYFHPAIEQYFADVDLILHAGDIGNTAVLDMLERIAPTQAVFGNVDGQDLRLRTREFLDVELEGVRFVVTHIAGRPGRYAIPVSERLRREPPDVLICGHSHILRIERDTKLGGMLFINPGAAGRQGLHRVKTCIRLGVAGGRLGQAEVIHLDGAPDA